MKVVVVDAPHAVLVAEVPEPILGLNDVLIDVGACGICGTDLHIIDGEFPPIHYPIIPGREFAGVVEAVGDQVVVDPTLNCGDGLKV
jgi:D-arabinose 1-dehydrogenase-like Zn-dependent alcohol dehydrogenase